MNSEIPTDENPPEDVDQITERHLRVAQAALNAYRNQVELGNESDILAKAQETIDEMGEKFLLKPEDLEIDSVSQSISEETAMKNDSEFKLYFEENLRYENNQSPTILQYRRYLFDKSKNK